MEASTRSVLSEIHSDIRAQHPLRHMRASTGASLDGGGGGGGVVGRAVREEKAREEGEHDHLQALEEKMQDRMAEMQDRTAEMLEEQLRAFEALLRKHSGASQPADLSSSHSHSVQPPAGPELANGVGDLIRELEKKVSSKLDAQFQLIEKMLGGEMQQVSPRHRAARESSHGAFRRLTFPPAPWMRPDLAGTPEPCQA